MTSIDIINQLYRYGQKDPAYKRLTKAVQSEARNINISGLADPQKSCLAMSLTRVIPQKSCFLVADELRVRSLAMELQALSAQPVLVYRARELNLTEADAVSRENEMQRLAVLSRLDSADFSALIIPASATMQKLMPHESFKKFCLQIEFGGQMELEELCRHLEQTGYERSRLTESAGQFSRRGDIVDIACPVADEITSGFGYRISFFDREIDAIKIFALENQRTLQTVKKIIIPPAREIIIDETIRDSLANSVIRAGTTGACGQEQENVRYLKDNDAQRIAAGISFPGLDRWLSLIYPGAESVLDYVCAAGLQIFLDEPRRFNNRLDAAQAEFQERISTMLIKGQVAPVSSEIIFRGIDINNKLAAAEKIITLSQLDSELISSAVDITIRGTTGESYRGQENKLVHNLRERHKTGGRTMVFTGSETRQQKIAELLAENGLQADVLPAGFSQGFVWPGAGLTLIGTRDLFGSDSTRKRRRTQGGLKIDLFSDLTPGELVVHEAHGIGRYTGLENLVTGNSRRDYLKIEYSGSDSLYIPIDSLDQIQKYVGTDGREPRLSRLGGQEWQRLKERARESIRQLATDLVKLYAQRASVQGINFSADTVWQEEFEELFPYEETEDQLRSIKEIKSDMESQKVMDRLLCGDVGYGKTEVAFRAMFKCVMESRQAVLLAPTTVLAQQHYEVFKKRAEGFPIEIGLLSRFAAKSIQKKTLQGLAQGSIDVLIGTHRILSKDVRLKRLGLLVIDEEQRFGVDHKEQIKALAPGVDVLTLSATPIPRTLHMAMSGIRDISVLEEPPHDRRPVQTYVMEYDREIVSEAILREVSRQGQVFYLYNDTRRIAEKARDLESRLPGARILYAHGKMSARRLEDIMRAFIEQEADILVCTTIIESGLDMPNVNTIIVENSDRLGLAQLYQLRGRVGRSDRQAYAYITYHKDKVLTEIAEKRLTAIRDFTELGSGFKIALRDLEVRGAGNLLGAEQHGHLESIGYDLYCRMLDETVREMQGQKVETRTPAVIEIEADAYLDTRYIPDEGIRMDMYRRTADINSLEDYRDVLDEWIDRFGDPPQEATTLAKISFIRASAEHSGMVRIYRQQRNLVMLYAENHRPDMDVLSHLLNLPQYKGKVLFNAGTKPHLVYRNSAHPPRMAVDNLFLLFVQMSEKKIAAN